LNIQCDVCIIGGGSGGIGAAIAAARTGVDVVLIEKAAILGGNTTVAGVCCWECGVGGTGIPFDIYRRLKQIPGGVGILSHTRHLSWTKEGGRMFPFGEARIDPSLSYEDTLRRHGYTLAHGGREHWHGVMLEPEIYAPLLEEMLAETGNCRVMLNTAFVAAEADADGLKEISADGPQGRVSVRAKTFIDSSGDAVLCRALGCEEMTGRESKARFGEPNAPAEHTDTVNGVSLIFRITPAENPGVETLPDDIPPECWWWKGWIDWPVACINEYPNGDRNVNMLPTMEGRDFVALGFEAAYRECTRRVLAYWHYMQTSGWGWENYRLRSIAPALGVRESRRIIGEYVLTQHDLIAGLSRQTHDDIICIADHAIDIHGEGGGRAVEVSEPYGVPFRCLIVKGKRNLLTACRAASFSAIAASSCRLSRVMISLGQAAGTAAGLAAQAGIQARDISPQVLRDSLRKQNVTLDWNADTG